MYYFSSLFNLHLLFYICYFFKYLLSQIEVFGILVTRAQGKQNVPYCLDCALKLSPLLEGFTCIEEKNKEDLINIYDTFTLNESTTSIAARICSK